MTPQPPYSAADLHPAYQLRYGWSAWPTHKFPNAPSGVLLQELNQAWEKDGIRMLEWRWSSELIQFTFSTKPDVTPVCVAGRAKGRLEHALRTKAGTPAQFSRKVGLRSIGDTTRETVEHYIASQVENASFLDPAFAALMRRFTVADPSADLSQPTATNSGRYWYNLHLVLVTDARYRIVDEKRLTIICDRSLQIAAKKGYGISSLSVMPDHLHIALRGDIQQSPQEIALAYLNNLSFALGQGRIWSGNYYVGTFSEYDMNAVRRRSEQSVVGRTPAGLPGR